MVKIPRPTRYYSSRQEKQVAKAIDGKVNRNSGAAPFCAGDVIKENILIECKTTTKPVASFSIKKTVLEKIKQEAFEMGKDYYSVAFNFGPDEKSYYIIDEKTMKILIQNLTNLR